MSSKKLGLLGAAAICCMAGAGMANAEDTTGFQATSNGLEYRSASGDVRLNLGGRLHFDAVSVDDGTTTFDTTDTRRARLEFSARLYDRFRLRIDREFTNGGGWRNVWARYDLSDNMNVKVGNFIAPFSMEDMGSSNDTMFMERSLVQALAPGFGQGAGFSYEGRHFGFAAAYVGDAIDQEDNVQAKKGKGVTLRGTYNPIEHRNEVMHLGIGFETRDFSSTDVRRISSGPETSFASSVVSTGSIANVDRSRSYNLEAAYSSGPLLLQGQYVSSTLERSVGSDLKFDGYYAQVGWIVTGERHTYSDTAGVFSRPDVRSGWGAVELAARFSDLDLSEAAGGEAQDWTAGANWFINNNLRLSANYVHSKVDPGIGPNIDIDAAEARFQIDF